MVGTRHGPCQIPQWDLILESSIQQAKQIRFQKQKLLGLDDDQRSKKRGIIEGAGQSAKRCLWCGDTTSAWQVLQKRDRPLLSLTFCHVGKGGRRCHRFSSQRSSARERWDA